MSVPTVTNPTSMPIQGLPAAVRVVSPPAASPTAPTPGGTTTTSPGGIPTTTAPQGPSAPVQGVPLAAAPPAAQAPNAPAQQRTRLYILQSGWNDPRSDASAGFRRELIARGISPDHIITLRTPYSMTFNETDLRELREYVYGPENNPNDADTVRARQLNFFLNSNSTAQFRRWNTSYQAFQRTAAIYRNSANLDSAQARTLYQQYDQDVQARLRQLGLRADQVEVVGIGHSAGGQILSTISGLAGRNNGPQFSTIETMGSPFIRANAPEAVRMIYNVSRGDEVLERCEALGPQAINAQVRRVPPRDNNDEVHEFDNVGHSQWYSSGRVFDRVVFRDLGVRNPQFFQWLGRTVGNAITAGLSHLPIPFGPHGPLEFAP